MYVHRAVSRTAKRRMMIVVAMIMPALLVLIAPWSPVQAPAYAAGTNLLSNPGCENGTNYFQGYQANITAVTAIKRFGAASCKVTATTGSFYSLASTQPYANPQIGRVFTGAAWVRADTNNGRSVYVALRERGGSAADRTVYGTGVQLTTQWQLVTGTITVQSAGRTALDFYVVEDPGAAGHVFYTDDMTFQLTSSSPSGQAMPVGDLPGWKQIFAEDFTVNAPTGSWGASCATDPDAANKIVYIGAAGTQWRTYPDCFTDTYQHRPYRSDQVLSVHDGVLDFSLHNVNGQPAGANPSPVINAATASQYQTYGRYTARFKTDVATLSEYHIAWLLWPADDADWKCAESDFPEANLNDRSVAAFAHYGCSGAQDAYNAGIDFTQWHTFTQEWSPGIRKYYLDGTLIGTSSHSVYAQPERYQLQTETIGNGTHAGHLTVDWVAVYAYHS
jgi:hypothetical protein